MDQYDKKVFRQLPNFIPEIVESYSSDKMAVFKANHIFSKTKEFDCYKFHIISTQMPPILIEKKEYVERANSIFPINPEQAHAYKIQGQVSDYSVVFMEKEMIQRTSKLIYGKNHITFETEHIPLTSEFKTMFQVFIQEANHQQAGYEFVMESLNMQMAIYLLRHAKSNVSRGMTSKEYHDQKLVKQVRNYFVDHLCEEFSLNDIAEEVNYSPYYFIRIFKGQTGKTPFEYLLEIKIEQAENLLKKTNKSIAEIAYNSGFKSRSHFSTVFKKKIGQSPQQYRKYMR